MFTIKRFASTEKDLAEKAISIRKRVFVEEQGVDPSIEYDNEEESHHYLLMLGEKAIATARWRETEKGIKLERFAVIPEFRNRGFGEIILNEVLRDIENSNRPVYLHAQLSAVPFYERNGFYKSGEQFTEAGIGHYLMKLTD